MRYLLLIPTAFFPYFPVIVMLAVNAFFPEGELPVEPVDSEMIMGIAEIMLFILWLVLPIICNVIFMILSRKSNPRNDITAVLIVKLVHIPAYVVIFIFGIFLGLMFFMTLPLIILLILFDCFTLCLSSMLSIFVSAKNIKNNTASSIVTLVLQLFFCADVISFFILFCITRKNKPLPPPAVSHTGINYSPVFV